MEITRYYELKQKYQTRINNRKNTIKKNEELTLKEKRAQYKKIVPKCINCDKAGGTLFEEKNGMLKAVCASSNPCDLNINIKRVCYDDMRNLTLEYDKTSENLKMRIIMTKLDYLFGVNTSKEDTIDKFNELKDKLAAITEKQIVTTKNYGDIISGINRDPLLSDAEVELLNEVDELKHLYKDYKDNGSQAYGSQAYGSQAYGSQAYGSQAYLTEMIEKYITKILPLSETIRKLKYGYYEIEHDEDGIVATLVANPYRLEQIEQEQKI